MEGNQSWLPGFAEVWEVHFCQQVPLDAPIVAVLEEDTLLSAVRLVACRTLSTDLDVELDKVHPRSIQIPAHQLSFPSLSKEQRNHRSNYLGAICCFSFKFVWASWLYVKLIMFSFIVERSKSCYLTVSGYILLISRTWLWDPWELLNYTKEYSKVFNNKAKLILIKTLLLFPL